MAFNRAAPSTMGTLISSGMMAAAKQFAGHTSLQAYEVAEIPQIFADAISLRGKAKLGDKTVLDALIPYAVKLKQHYSDTNDFRQSLDAAAESAWLGMERTKALSPAPDGPNGLRNAMRIAPTAERCCLRSLPRNLRAKQTMISRVSFPADRP
ncbi:DAK2 domain-containing protein [Paenibacillaceae bacterium]|nr:DAK2 domain-containing protein [Paenibacillaceae bacterium]